MNDNLFVEALFKRWIYIIKVNNMSSKTKSTGRYELFKSTKGNDILHLKRIGWNALVEGQKGEIIVHSDSNHQKERNLQEGVYYYIADFEGDPDFNDVPHLFLEKGEKFKEYILPNGLPASKDTQKKIITSKSLISKAKLASRLKNEGKAQRGEGDKLFAKTKKELDRIAREKKVAGRSKMNKDELVSQLEKII